ncbi:MAG: AI-2E family transporter [Candidatus Terrybacteria bacterium]|nr:AI-2E family transporter [Candidatus Terrybacteria bacterium]
MSDKNLTINITSATIFKAILLVLLFVFLYIIRDLLVVVLFSVVIASAIEPLAVWFQKKKIPRIPAVVFVYLIIFLFLGALFYLIVPVIFSEFSSFTSRITLYLGKPSQINILQGFLSNLPISISQILHDLSARATDYISGFSAGFFHTVAKIFGGALSFILIIILSFYLSVQEKGIENFIRVVVPLRHENYILDLWTRSRNKIGRWLQGEILLGVIVGVLTFLGLTILGVDYALTFALLAGLFELIPIFGPILSSIPPIMITLVQNPVLSLKIAILYIIVQQFENHLIYPLVVRKVVGIPPIMTILALIIGGKLAGFLGIVLAVPVLTVIVEILNDIELKKHPHETPAV